MLNPLSKSVIVIFYGGIEKLRHKTKLFLSRITIDKEDIFDQNIIAQKFNKFLIKIGPNLAKKFSNPKISFESYIQYKRPNFYGSEHWDEELEKALANLKLNKSLGWVSISSNVVKGISNKIICS